MAAILDMSLNQHLVNAVAVDPVPTLIPALSRRPTASTELDAFLTVSHPPLADQKPLEVVRTLVYARPVLPEHVVHAIRDHDVIGPFLIDGARSTALGACAFSSVGAFLYVFGHYGQRLTNVHHCTRSAIMRRSAFANFV